MLPQEEAADAGPVAGGPGPLLLVSILAPGFSEAVEHEARARGIDVEVEAISA
jgi:hypothetical protein